MNTLLRILHLEDDPSDATLIQNTLETSGISCAITRVETRDEFIANLEFSSIDLVLADYWLPTFDGLSATTLARSRWQDMPVIIVSGTLGEERAINALKNGATDYVLKERLSRLAPAVHRAMREVKDRAKHRRLTAQFIEVQKMEVIGKLASGVAHDFNNILAVIMGYSDLLELELGSDHSLHKYTSEIRHASDRAAGLTQQLIVFSRKQEVHPVVLNLNHVVQEMSKMLGRLIGDNIELLIVPGHDLNCVKADSGYIGQMLMNLVINARDAMPGGGKLTITTENVILDDNSQELPKGTAPGEYVMLAVRDTGTGMTDEVKDRLFEAFFTTKPLGKGTGLGLTTCQTIVQQSGGHIHVKSQPGKGTIFQIYLPKDKEALPGVSQRSPKLPARRGTETLLLVEDDTPVRHLARCFLESHGYEVLSASNGQQGLQVAQAHHGAPIRLVVTDVVMPLMGGPVMVEWLKTAFPDLKILFTSGYTDDALGINGILGVGVEFLSKPYSSATLLHRVREMLDSPAAKQIVPHP